MKSFRLSVLLLLAVSLLAACGGEPRSAVKPMQFNVDPSQLGAPVEAADLGIRFQPPAGWAPLPAAALDSIGRVLSGNALDLQARFVFTHPAQGSMLSVATIGHTGATALDEQVARYAEALAARETGGLVQRDEYLKDDIRVAQFLMQTARDVTFTLFFSSPGGAVLRFDYIIPRESYPSQVKAIESSIGSIQRVG